jgi:hypothetical protein
MPAISDPFHDKTDSPAFLIYVAEKFGSNLMTLDPFVRRCFGVELRRLPRKSRKFRYNFRVESRGRGFVDIQAKLLSHVKLQIVYPDLMTKTRDSGKLSIRDSKIRATICSIP